VRSPARLGSSTWLILSEEVLILRESTKVASYDIEFVAYRRQQLGAA
jgi:hypothetical protein